MSLRAGIANGTAALVSFFFGLFLDPNRRKLSNLPVALAGLSLLMGAIVGIAYAGERSCRVEEEHERLLTEKRSERVAATCPGYIGEKRAGSCKQVHIGTMVIPRKREKKMGLLLPDLKAVR